ncbi:MAG: aminotransferase class I/II-fold pyridoxal phosphate-dependent enzyme, partial [Rhodoferax sp.]|nr:aminotransferase class I/II-fold pyridoxal phosphate-dependent enzyme [Rhodoferax sp.]
MAESMSTPSPSEPVPVILSGSPTQPEVRRGPVPRQGILRIKPHMVAAQVGDSSAGRINLSSNESAWGPSPLALTAAHRALDTIERYPEDAPLKLAQSIGQRYGLNPDQLVVGHGSDELLQRLARGFLNPGDEVIHSARGYLKFPNYAHAMGAVPVAAPDQDFQASVDQMLACVSPRTRMVLLANPDNPTGTLLSGTEIRRLHAGLPENVLLVLDSAYAEYVADPGYELPQALIDSASNVVMTRTFSKIHGLAGMRLGWLYGPAPIVDVLQRLGMTFPVSAPAAAAGIAAVMDREWQEQGKSQN